MSALVIFDAQVPPRALFRSEPAVAHGSGRQKLSNFVVRMANASMVPVHSVIRDLLVWPERSGPGGSRERQPFATGQCSELVNATGNMARYWSDRVNYLAGRTDSAGLTLLPFAPVLNDPAGLMTRQRRWCSACLQDDLEGGSPIYERLLWSLRLVTHCPVHEVRLRSQCPTCGYVHQRELTRRAVSGMCSRCHGWLGAGVKRERCQQDSSPDIWRERWTSRQLSELLDLSPEQTGNVSPASVTTMLNAGIDALCDGSAKEFAKLCGKSKSSLSEWRNGVNFPSLPTLIQLSWNCGIPLTAWLTGNRDAWHMAKPPSRSPAMALARKERVVVRRDWTAIATYLDACVGRPDYKQSWAATAREVGIDPSELRRRFPVRAARVSERARVARTAAAEARRVQRRERIEALVRETVRELEATGQKPTRRLLDAQLRARGLTVRHAEYRWVQRVLAAKQ